MKKSFKHYNTVNYDIYVILDKFGGIGKYVYFELLEILSLNNNSFELNYDMLSKYIFRYEHRRTKIKNLEMLIFIIEKSGHFKIIDNMIYSKELNKHKK